MEYIQLNKKWTKHLKFIGTVIGLTTGAAVIATAFPAVRDMVWMLLGMTAARLDMSSAEKAKTVFRHLKRGTTYNVIGKARLQTEWPVVDNVELTVYQGTDDSKLWARPTDEFEDGRFVKVEE